MEGQIDPQMSTEKPSVNFGLYTVFRNGPKTYPTRYLIGNKEKQ